MRHLKASAGQQTFPVLPAGLGRNRFSVIRGPYNSGLRPKTKYLMQQNITRRIPLVQSPKAHWRSNYTMFVWVDPTPWWKLFCPRTWIRVALGWGLSATPTITEPEWSQDQTICSPPDRETWVTCSDLCSGGPSCGPTLVRFPPSLRPAAQHHNTFNTTHFSAHSCHTLTTPEIVWTPLRDTATLLLSPEQAWQCCVWYVEWGMVQCEGGGSVLSDGWWHRSVAGSQPSLQKQVSRKSSHRLVVTHD